MQRPESERKGFCKVFYMSGTSSILHRSEYERIKIALENKLELLEVSDLQGDQIIIKVSRIETVADYSEAGILAYDTEQPL